MAAGLPVVASDFDGYRDLVEEGVTGYRIPTTWLPQGERIADLQGLLEPTLASFFSAQGMALNQVSLSQRLELLIRDTMLRRRLGEAGRAAANRRFHWRVVIGQYESLWDELARRAQAAPPTQTIADPNVADMARIFQHYPSRILDDTAALRVTDLGRDVHQGKVLMPATYEDLGPLLPGELVTWLLSWLVVESASLGQLTARGTEELGADPALTRSCAAWLIKYGLLAGPERA